MIKDKNNSPIRVYTLDQLILYRIEIAGTLKDDWSVWIDNVTIQIKRDDSGFEKTILIGELDQAALLGIIRRLIYLGFPLISIESYPNSRQLEE